MQYATAMLPPTAHTMASLLTRADNRNIGRELLTAHREVRSFANHHIGTGNVSAESALRSLSPATRRFTIDFGRALADGAVAPFSNDVDKLVHSFVRGVRFHPRTWENRQFAQLVMADALHTVAHLVIGEQRIPVHEALMPPPKPLHVQACVFGAMQVTTNNLNSQLDNTPESTKAALGIEP
jgi:hypothetical protein